MHYDITLKITYKYEESADASRHLVRLLPADLPGEQRLVAGALDVDPDPDERINHTDFFGNDCVELAFYEAYRRIRFVTHSRVERLEREPKLNISPRLSALSEEIGGYRGVGALAPYHFAGQSLRVPIVEETTAYAQALVGDDPSAMEAVLRIGAAIYDDMTYDPEATSVETPMLEAFTRRHGVCQDYSHIMIACLRGIGVPAGYVSGFLRTIPPPGKKRLEGADAMHAWVRAWCGSEIGWVEYDPTNALTVSADHIVIARGRDYADVAPVKGVLRTSGDHTSKQSVDVVPV